MTGSDCPVLLPFFPFFGNEIGFRWRFFFSEPMHTVKIRADPVFPPPLAERSRLSCTETKRYSSPSCRHPIFHNCFLVDVCYPRIDVESNFLSRCERTLTHPRSFSWSFIRRSSDGEVPLTTIDPLSYASFSPPQNQKIPVCSHSMRACGCRGSALASPFPYLKFLTPRILTRAAGSLASISMSTFPKAMPSSRSLVVESLPPFLMSASVKA